MYSPIARQICGFSPDEPLTLEKIRAITHPEDLKWTSAQAKRAIDPEIRENAAYEFRIVRADNGEVRWVQAYGESHFSGVGNVERAVAYIGAIRDVTEEKHAELQLTSSETRLRLALDAANMAVWEVELASNSITGSPDLNRLCGFPEDSRPSLDDFRSRYAAGEQERVRDIAEEAMSSGSNRIQTVIRHIWPDKSEHHLLLRAQVIPEDPVRVIGVLMDVTEAVRAEELISAQAGELRHRLKNLIAIVSSVARQSWRSVEGGTDALSEYLNRLDALGAAADLMFSEEDSEIGLCQLVERVIAPFRSPARNAFSIAGDDIAVNPAHANSIAMALHELCTNAMKYGALSVAGGQIQLDWSVSGDDLEIRWREHSGPPVETPMRQGFGSKLLRTLFPMPDQLDLRFEPDGVQCVLQIPAAVS